MNGCVAIFTHVSLLLPGNTGVVSGRLESDFQSVLFNGVGDDEGGEVRQRLLTFR